MKCYRCDAEIPEKVERFFFVGSEYMTCNSCYDEMIADLEPVESDCSVHTFTEKNGWVERKLFAVKCL